MARAVLPTRVGDGGEVGMGTRRGAALLCAALALAGALSTGAVLTGRAPAEAGAEGLRRLLTAREEELGAARTRLRELSDEPWYSEAQALGVARAVESSGLSDRWQRALSAAIVREARRNGLDPLLVVALIRAESAFDPFAVSAAGARGLMQVMPDTARQLAERRGQRLKRRSALFDPELNVELGCAYLAELLRRFRTPERALLAYNLGPSAAGKLLSHRRPGSRRPLRGYPRRVLAEYQRLTTPPSSDPREGPG